MTQRLIALVALVLLLALHTAAAAEFVPPKRSDKCPVCGMFVYKYPAWVAEIIFDDNSYAVFDGTKDMLKYYFDMARYNPEKTRDDIAAIYVTEYYSNRIMPADDLFFVLGSDVLGPMGHEFIPVKGEPAAQTFLLEHKGNRMLRFDEITPADIPD
jgi:nitrous oxide reductase accessory protein NosL